MAEEIQARRLQEEEKEKTQTVERAQTRGGDKEESEKDVRPRVYSVKTSAVRTLHGGDGRMSSSHRKILEATKRGRLLC